MNTKILNWVFKIISLLIFTPAVLLKLSSAEKSILTFTKLGVEPFGRYFTGGLELLVIILIFIPKFQWIGAGLGITIMIGALISHFLVLGIEGEAGISAISAFIALLSFSIQTYLTRQNNPFFPKK